MKVLRILMIIFFVVSLALALESAIMWLSYGLAPSHNPSDTLLQCFYGVFMIAYPLLVCLCLWGSILYWRRHSCWSFLILFVPLVLLVPFIVLQIQYFQENPMLLPSLFSSVRAAWLK